MRLLITCVLGFFSFGVIHSTNEYEYTLEQVNLNSFDVYSSLNDSISFFAFNSALQGYSYCLSNHQLKNDSIVALIDYSMSSTKNRLFVIDLKNNKVLHKSLVAHGIESGKLVPETFSNKKLSHKSSLGFYITGDTYQGKHGYSLRLNGIEQSINDNAYNRAVVIHGANYVSTKFISTHGYLGRSFGCPALPIEKTEEIINAIRKGTLLFIYSPDEEYFLKSKIISHF